MGYNEFQLITTQNKMRIRGVAENGLNSVRASFHIYNTFEEADALADLVKRTV